MLLKLGRVQVLCSLGGMAGLRQNADTADAEESVVVTDQMLTLLTKVS